MGFKRGTVGGFKRGLGFSNKKGPTRIKASLVFGLPSNLSSVVSTKEEALCEAW